MSDINNEQGNIVEDKIVQTYTESAYIEPEIEKGMAITSMVLGIVSIVTSIICCCIPFISIVLGIVAVILGIIVINANKENTIKKGKNFAISGIVLGALGIVFSIVLGIIMFVFGANFQQYYPEFMEEIYPEFMDEYYDEYDDEYNEIFEDLEFEIEDL